MSAQEEFEQIRRQFIDPIQHDYEVIRPIVLLVDGNLSCQNGPLGERSYPAK